MFFWGFSPTLVAMRKVLFGVVAAFLLHGCSRPLQVQRHEGSLETLQTLSPDPEAQALIAPYKKQIDAKMKEPLGTSAIDMPKVRGEVETLLGNFVADLVLQSTQQRLPEQPVDACLLNSGGLRASIAKGPILLEDVFSLMPFDNLVVLVKLSENDMMRMFNYLAEHPGTPIAGMRMEIEDGNPDDMEIAGIDWEDNKEARRPCWIITSDFLAGGGDHMDFLTEPIERIETGWLLRDIIADHIREKNRKGLAAESALDGRMRYDND